MLWLKRKPDKCIWCRWLLLLVAIFLLLVFCIAVFLYLFENDHKNKIYPGVTVGNFYLGGNTPDEAKIILNKRIDKINQSGIPFEYQGETALITPTISSIESDLAYEILTFDTEGVVREAYTIGRSGSFYHKYIEKYEAWRYGINLKIKFGMNEPEIINILKEHFNKMEVEPSDAKLVFEVPTRGQIVFDIKEEKYGKVIDYREGTNELYDKLSVFDLTPIRLYSNIKNPSLFKYELDGFVEVAENIIKRTPVYLSYKPRSKYKRIFKWRIKNEQLAEWLEVKKNPEAALNTLADKVLIGLNDELFVEYLSESIAPDIDIKPVDAKFEIKNGRVIEFQQSSDGLGLNIESTFSLFENDIIRGTSTQIDVAVTDLKSKIQVASVNDLGISELIATGHSNHAGSPANRRHNISIGADTLNGLLIKPKEEFSLIGALGEINGEAGYLQELVIKNNKTIPEYGGGLCQIGTTLFRTVTESGLPVTMRRNHSYRVSYYEPAGTDATIYNPWPDFRFINDTSEYILIQTRIEGDDIYFDFWGTKDGRIVEKTDPEIYNIVPPPPTRYIETLDLAPGKKRCTESAHSGADAYFDYKVTYPGGEEKEERFSSHYVPWQAVCLVGVEKLSNDIGSTSTSIILE